MLTFAIEVEVKEKSFYNWNAKWENYKHDWMSVSEWRLKEKNYMKK